MTEEDEDHLHLTMMNLINSVSILNNRLVDLEEEVASIKTINEKRFHD